MPKLEERYIVDERVGRIAIIDTYDPNYDPERPGLESETPGVIKHEHGYWSNNEWNLPNKTSKRFHAECRFLNAKQEILYDKLEQQLIGAYEILSGGGVKSLLSSMGLTEKEWERFKSYRCNKSMVNFYKKEVEEYLNNNDK